MEANDRIDIRLSKEHKKLIKYAAAISGFKTVSEFVVTYATKEASRIINEDAKVLKSINDKTLFAKMLLNPPAPNTHLKSARDLHDQLSNARQTNGNKDSEQNA